MTTLKQIQKEQQFIARCEKSVALEKLKKRRADTRRKIELGGLVIKSGLDYFGKAVVLGVLCHALGAIENDANQLRIFEDIGKANF